MAGHRGQRKVLKRTNAPKSYGLKKLGGVFAIKHMPGPHSKNSSICVSYLLRYNLKYAETNNEVSGIMKKRIISVNGKIITNERYPVGPMDVLTINGNESYLVNYDSHGRFTLLPLKKNQQNVRLLKCTKKYATAGVSRLFGRKNNHANAASVVCQMHNGFNFRFQHPSIKVNDTVVMRDNKVKEILTFTVNQTAMAIGGNNVGRIGNIVHIDNANKTISVRDGRSNTFITKIENVMVIGGPDGPVIPCHRDNGIRLHHVERRCKKLGLEVPEGFVAN